MKRLAAWLTGSGIASFVAGLVLASPLADLLPVDLLMAAHRTEGREASYWRVAPGGDGVDALAWVGWALIGVGLGLMAWGWRLKVRR